MSDPSHFDSGEWFSAILSGIVAGILSGMGAFAMWFKGSKARIYESINAVKVEFKDMERRHVENQVKLAQLGANQINTEDKLEELKMLQKDSVQRIERTIETNTVNLTRQITDLMSVLRTKT